MFAARLEADADETAFRAVARRALAAGVAPADVGFTTPDAPSLFPDLPAPAGEPAIRVSKRYADLLRDAICHRAEDRFALLYDVLWRSIHGNPGLAANAADPAVARLGTYARNVRRDIHKMHAFVRFRAQEIDGRPVFVAWFEPEHHILRRAVPFFVDRFTGMDWLIATPIGTAAWRERELVFGPPVSRPATEADETLDTVWTAYFRTTFNPARLRVKAMMSEMPKHYWRNMPEAAAIPALVAGARARTDGMTARAPDAPPAFAAAVAARGATAAPTPVPATPLGDLAAEERGCRRCPLYANATQVVPGEGPADARIMVVGEQPGDQEDIAGRPFVGPAGQVLDRAFAEAGIERAELFLTNAVKHFKFEPRGKRRLHKKPNAGEVAACRWWIEREIATVRPRLIVALGGTAAAALAGRAVSVTRERGPAAFPNGPGFITVHPSFLLRIPDADEKAHQYALFVSDLRKAGALARGG